MRVVTYQPRQIHNDIRSLDREAYAEATRDFIERFRQGYQGEAAFYRFGAVRTPGVSDIDLLIVTPDEYWREAHAIAAEVTTATAELRYMFMHPPLVICQALLPHLRAFHTLENCRWITGDDDPLASLSVPTLTDDTCLVRHAIWNGFIRVAALELGRKEVGLRRALMLIHNLLTSARHGNRFLNQPMPFSLNTETMRETLLRAPRDRQGPLLRDAIDQVIVTLNSVDSRLDHELGTRLEDPQLIRSRNYYLVAPLNLKVETSLGARPLLRSARLVPVPGYAIAITVRLALKLRDVMPDLAEFAAMDVVPALGHLDLDPYTDHMKIALRQFEKHHLPYAFVRPFAHRRKSQNIRSRLVNSLREQVLSLERSKWQVA